MDPNAGRPDRPCQTRAVDPKSEISFFFLCVCVYACVGCVSVSGGGVALVGFGLGQFQMGRVNPSTAVSNPIA